MQQARKPARRVGLRRRKAETGHRKEPAHQKYLTRAAVRVGFGPFRDFQIASGALRFVNRRAASRSIHRRRNQVDWIHIEKVMVAGSWVSNQKISQNFHFFQKYFENPQTQIHNFQNKISNFSKHGRREFEVAACQSTPAAAPGLVVATAFFGGAPAAQCSPGRRVSESSMFQFHFKMHVKCT